MTKRKKWLVYTIIVIAAPVWLYLNFRETPLQDDGVIAYTYSQDYVKQKLRSPGTADFPRASKVGIKRLAPYRYRITAYVDSQNGFGGTVRTNYTCIIEYTDSTSRIEELIFE